MADAAPPRHQQASLREEHRRRWLTLTRGCTIPALPRALTPLCCPSKKGMWKAEVLRERGEINLTATQNINTRPGCPPKNGTGSVPLLASRAEFSTFFPPLPAYHVSSILGAQRAPTFSQTTTWALIPGHRTGWSLFLMHNAHVPPRHRIGSLPKVYCSLSFPAMHRFCFFINTQYVTGSILWPEHGYYQLVSAGNRTCPPHLWHTNRLYASVPSICRSSAPTLRPRTGPQSPWAKRGTATAQPSPCWRQQALHQTPDQAYLLMCTRFWVLGTGNGIFIAWDTGAAKCVWILTETGEGVTHVITGIGRRGERVRESENRLQEQSVNILTGTYKEPVLSKNLIQD